MSIQLILFVLATVIPAYLLGSINGAIVTSKLLYRKDIRDYGSGNAGLTNFYRVFGKGGTLLVIIIDVLKTLLPILFGGWLFARFMDMLPTVTFPFGYFIEESFFGQALAGLAVMLGHCFPLFHKFKGGKGVMAIGIIVIVIDWRLALIGWGMFILVIAITRYVSLGSILGSTAFCVAMPILGIGTIADMIVIILCVLLIIVRHAENIKRIVKGEESKFSLRRKSKE